MWCWLRWCDEETSKCILLQLIELHIACAAIDNHAVALCCLDNVVVNDSDSLLIPDTAIEDTLCLLFSLGQRCHKHHIIFVTLYIKDGDTGTRAFRNGVSIAAQLINMQVLQHDAGFGLATDTGICLAHELLFLFFFVVIGPWNHIQLRFQSTVRYSVVFHFDEVLEVVVCGGPFHYDWTSLYLYQSIVLYVDLAS